MSKPELLVVEDDPVVGSSITTWLRAQDFKTHWAKDVANADRILGEARLAAALVDLGLPGEDGLAVVKRAVALDIPTLVWTVDHRAASVTRALTAGARGYVTKDEPVERLAAALHGVMVGGTWLGQTARAVLVPNPETVPHLSPREREIAVGLSRGLSYEQVAEQIGIQIGTLQRYVRRLYDKLGISSKAELAALTIRHGWERAP